MTWSVLTCHELGFDADVGHVDLWPALIMRLAEVWSKDQRVLRLYLKDHYTGLARGRVTHPQGRFLICHGHDAPVADWQRRVIQKFNLDRRSAKFVYDEHERTLREDRQRLDEILGIGRPVGKDGIEEAR